MHLVKHWNFRTFSKMTSRQTRPVDFPELVSPSTRFRKQKGRLYLPYPEGTNDTIHSLVESL